MSALTLPTSREEAWRWSRLDALSAFSSAVPSGTRGDVPLIGCGGPRLLFVDGVLDEAASDVGRVTIGAAEARAGDHPLGAQAGAQGWALRLAAEASPAATIEIVHLATGGASHLAGEIVLAAGAQASVVETFVGAGWANRATGMTLGEGARLALARRVTGGGFASLTDTVTVARAGSVNIVTLAAGTGDTRIDQRLSVTGDEGFAEAGGALLGRGEQRHDANAVLRHAAQHGSSRQVWRMVADDAATCSAAARVEVARDAQKTDGEQSLKGLLLARTATVNLKPELEIFADDVKCAHGATVGELDRQALFYLASRGLPPQGARALLTRAFVADALARIGDGAVREAFAADADAWLAA